MSVHILQQAAEQRRSVYALTRNLPISQEEVAGIVEHAVKHTPSSFNSQSTRAVVLFGTEHERLWEIARAELAKVVPADKFQPTAEKLDMFKAAAGSILFFEDQQTVQKLQTEYPPYAANFPVWADQAGAMVQYAVWTALAAAGVGANLQHYNPLIDAETAAAWHLPTQWQLRAQMVFGGIGTEAGEKTFLPLEERVKVFGL